MRKEEIGEMVVKRTLLDVGAGVLDNDVSCLLSVRGSVVACRFGENVPLLTGWPAGPIELLMWPKSEGDRSERSELAGSDFARL